MDLSDPATPHASSSPNDATSTRRSGRVKHKPVLLQTDPNASLLANGTGKRKRDANLEEDDVDIIGSESSDLDESNGDPDEEELKEKRRKSRSKKPVTKPAAKKPKTGAPNTTSLPVRPATNGVKKPSKPRQTRAKPSAVIDDEGTGLFSEVFSQGHTVAAVASEWITRYEQHNANAMCEIVNFVLKCTGCDLQVDVHDIEDPDNAASKLEDLQEEHQAKNITDYPLISRTKAYTSFRATMTGFFRSLVQAAHAAGLLYSDLALIENIEVWVTAMSSSPIRPFRHTATVIALAMESTLCAVYTELADSTANTMRQKEGEQKKKAVNKKRVADLQNKVAEGERKSGSVNKTLDDIFNAVFIHRYRDVDPKIRVDCVAALGTWITAAPDKFFTANYLRYLGWLLSDTSAPTRAEVVKHLSKLYRRKEDIGRLRGFTERFRPRYVEMAIRDAEPSIRAAAVEMLDLVRDTGLLEPDDIDNIGRLIFDAEPKVRKAVAGFFGENINDLFESVVEELGGDEGMAEAVGEDDPQDPEMPRRSWLKFKCLAEVLELYSAEDGEENAKLDAHTTGLIAGDMAEPSKYALAAQAVCQGVPDVKDWEFLAGYLLYDNSAAALNSRGSKSPDYYFKERCQLNDFEGMLLLEILNESVKQRLLEALESETDKKGKRSKARVDEAREAQENVAIHLAEVVPRLLRKFGANPTTAAVVLRIEQVLNLEIFEELRQGSTAYAALLDEINKQFLTHVDGHVLGEASNAMLRARTFEDLQEVTDSKLQELWSDTVSSLRGLTSARDNGQDVDLDSLQNTVTRIMNLARVSDCVSIFEYEPRSKSKNPTPAMTDSLATILMNLVRSDPFEGEDERGDDSNVVTTNSIKALLFYHMWLVRSIQTSLTTGTNSAPRLPDIDPLADALLTAMITRSGTAAARVEAAEACLDLYTLYASLRNLGAPASSKDRPTVTPPNKNSQRFRPTNIDSSFSPIPPSCQTCILTIFAGVEKLYARLSRRKLEPAADDAVNDAPEDPESDVDEDEDTATGEKSQTQKLLAERSLCELAGKMVLAVVGRVFAPGADGVEKVRSRLKRNEKRLGANYREVVAYLDEKKPRPRAASKSKAKAPAATMKKGGKEAKSKERVVEVSSESEEEVGGIEDDDEENGELPDDRIEDVDADEADNAGPGHQAEEDEIMGD